MPNTVIARTLTANNELDPEVVAHEHFNLKTLFRGVIRLAKRHSAILIVSADSDDLPQAPDDRALADKESAGWPFSPRNEEELDTSGQGNKQGFGSFVIGRNKALKNATMRSVIAIKNIANAKSSGGITDNHADDKAVQVSFITDDVHGAAKGLYHV